MVVGVGNSGNYIGKNIWNSKVVHLTVTNVRSSTPIITATITQNSAGRKPKILGKGGLIKTEYNIAMTLFHIARPCN